jgi:hypothetical protein
VAKRKLLRIDMIPDSPTPPSNNTKQLPIQPHTITVSSTTAFTKSNFKTKKFLFLFSFLLERKLCVSAANLWFVGLFVFFVEARNPFFTTKANNPETHIERCFCCCDTTVFTWKVSRRVSRRSDAARGALVPPASITSAGNQPGVQGFWGVQTSDSNTTVINPCNHPKHKLL